jgi:tetratricopeptide (TPR) repeat protein
MTFEDVSRHAAQVVDVTRRRYMPPWPPEHGYGDFAGDRSLNAAQIASFAEWLAQGKPRGDTADLPPQPHFTGKWQMGAPDLVLRMARPFVLPAGGSDIFRNFILPSGLHETKYVRAIELRPGNPRVVHHANVVIDRTRALRRRDGTDGRLGFAGMDVVTEAAPGVFDPDSHFLFWKPGTLLHPEPDDMAWRLDPTSDLILNLHLQPSGKQEIIEAELGLYFTSRPPTRFPMLIQLEHDGAIDISPGDRQFEISDSLTLPVDVDALDIYPHAHYLGKRMEAWAILPDGTRRWLIRIPDWDINWQAVYEYRRPVFLPKGSKLAMRITYDNSSANPRNPTHPPKLVKTGNRSEDEMGHVWLQVLPKKSGGRLALQEALMRRRLEKYPGDFLAQYNLGALLQSNHQLAEAIAAYRGALRANSASATARNSLGAVLLTQGRFPEAIEELRASLRSDPAYGNARYNLAEAEAALGTIAFRQRQYPTALAHFREAARWNPENADIQANLGALLATAGDLPGAAQALEAALRLNPKQQAARANLDRVRAQMAARH